MSRTPSAGQSQAWAFSPSSLLLEVPHGGLCVESCKLSPNMISFKLRFVGWLLTCDKPFIRKLGAKVELITGWLDGLIHNLVDR